MGQKVSDVIRVWWLTPIPTEPSAVFVFLATPSAVSYVGLRTFWHRAVQFGHEFSIGWAKSSIKNLDFFTISRM